MYQVCLIHENGTSPENPETYPYRDVVLVRGKTDHMYRFPFQKGDIREKFEPRSKEVIKALSTRKPDTETKILGINKIQGQDILVILCTKSSPQKASMTDPTIVDAPNSCMRVLIDEIRQGRVCHLKIHSVVQNLFFASSPKDPEKIEPHKPYFYEPGSKLIPKEIALVRCEPDTPIEITHQKGFYKIPICGYHGTTEYALPNVYKNGLQPTFENGMYGNEMYYFGNFYKAIRYSFRGSSYQTMRRRDKLPVGSLELPNTAHTKSTSGKEKDSTIHMDLARDSPMLVRFVVFIKESVSLPDDMKNKDEKRPPFRLRPGDRVFMKKSDRYVTYLKDKEGPTRNIFIEEQVKEQLEKESVDKDVFIKNLKDAEVFPEASSLPEEINRETVLRNLYEKIHIATRDAFA